ncbi:MAG: hypothetical protein ACRKGH_01690 [Dehalogenimonas sp.]
MTNYYTRLDQDTYQCAACRRVFTGSGARHLAKTCCRDLKPLSTLAVRQAAEIVRTFTDHSDPDAGFIDYDKIPDFKRAPRRSSRDVNLDPGKFGNYSRSKRDPAAIIGRQLYKEPVQSHRRHRKRRQNWITARQ